MEPTDYTVIQYLQAHGPAPLAELPVDHSPNPEVRDAGARRFCPQKNARAIWYYDPEHDPEDVALAWVDQNPGATGRLTPRQLTLKIRDAGSEFKAIARDVVREVYTEAEYNRSFGGNSGGGDSGRDTSGYMALKNANPDDI